MLRRIRSSSTEGGGFAAGCACLALTAACLLPLSLRPAQGDSLALLFPPGASFEEITAAVGNAGGRLIRTGAFANIVVAYAASPDFSERIVQAGAWLTFDPTILGGCLFAGEAAPPTFPAGDD